MPPNPPNTTNRVFQCGNIVDFVALQVAQRLGDIEHIDDFATGISEGPIGRVFDILNRVKASADSTTFASEVRTQLLTSHPYD